MTHDKPTRVPDHTAIDEDGHILPYTPEQVMGIVARAVNEETLLALIMEMKDGSLAVQVLGEPSTRLADALETAATAYRRVLAGH